MPKFHLQKFHGIDRVQQKGFGWRPDLPDSRDFSFSELVHYFRFNEDPRVKGLPPKVSHREHCSPVRNQGYIGSCTGFAHAAAVEYLYRIDEHPLSTIYSPLWMYYMAREIEGTVGEDTGAYLRTGAKILQHVGITQESRWPYREDRFTDTPSRTSMEEATRWKVGPYYRADTLLSIRQALSAGYAVVGGFVCYQNMFTREVTRTGDIPMPSGSLLGGHAVQFMGYDDERRRLMIKNSWGEGWGDDGYGTLPYEFVERRWAWDFWVYTKESDATVWPRRKAKVAERLRGQ